MAVLAGAPAACRLVRHWVLLGERSIPKETHRAPASPAGRAPWLRLVGGGRGGSERNICSALPVQYGGDAAVDAGMPGARGGGSPGVGGFGGGAAAPMAALPSRGDWFQGAGAFSVTELAVPLGHAAKNRTHPMAGWGQGTRGGCSGAPVPGLASGDRADPGIMAAGGGGWFWHSQLRAASLAGVGPGLQPAGRSGVSRLRGRGLVEGAAMGWLAGVGGGGGCSCPPCQPARPCRRRAGFVSHCVNEHCC